MSDRSENRNEREFTVDPAGLIPDEQFRIEEIEVVPLRIWLKFKRAISRRQDVAVPDVEWVDNPVLVRVRTAGGQEGYGRVRVPSGWLGETTWSIAGALRDFYAPALIGSSLLHREANVAKIEKLLPGNPGALSALDVALHDALGKTLGLPIYALLGGAPAQVPMDWSVSIRQPERREEMIAEAVRAVGEFGCRILCVKVGPAENWALDIETFHAVRQAVGDDIEIGMDPNEGYDLPTAVRVLRALEADHVAYVEQPFARNQLGDLAALRAQTGVPVFLDEGAIELSDAIRVAHERAADGIVLKMWKTGSYSKTLKMAAIADAAGMVTTIGGTAQGNLLEAAAFAHLYAALPGRVLAGEFTMGLNLTVDQDPIATAPDTFMIKDGLVQVPDGPGVGVDVDIDAARDLALASYVIR
jgi:L-alanine-DL-glutamate epimerase-like enolase superfamily enzyme